MKRGKLISSVLATLGIVMISIALVIGEENTLEQDKVIETKNSTIQLKNMAASANNIINTETDNTESSTEAEVIPIEMEVAPASVIIPPRIEVYEGTNIIAEYEQ